MSKLKPGDITAYISKYLEQKGVDTSGLSPSAITAFVLAYEEVAGGASTSALTPSNIAALVVKYAEAENVDLTALKPSQIEALVSKFSEATGCDKSGLLKEFTAYITEYKEAAGVKKPTLNVQVGLSGYDLLAYRQWLKNNKVEVQGIVRLSEVYEDPSSALNDSGMKYWKNGAEIPVTAVTSEMLKPTDVAVLDQDGTMHILISTEVTGSKEAIEEMRTQVAEVDQFATTALGKAAGIMPTSLMGFIDQAEKRIKDAQNSLGQWWNFIYGGDAAIIRNLNTSMQNDFSPGRVAELSAYVSEVVAAIQQGQEVGQADIDNLNKILQFIQDLDTAGVGGNVTEGIAEGMAAAGWDSSAETVAANLEAAIKAALVINSPSGRMKPVGEYVAQGVGEGIAGADMSQYASVLADAIEQAAKGQLAADALAPFGAAAAEGLGNAMAGYSFSSAGSTVGSNARNAVSSSLNAGSLRSIGANAMAGLRAGILSGQAGVVSAMRSAAKAAVNAAKAELKINSPSRVFQDEIGRMAMKGFGQGVLEESKAQGRILRNAARYLTDEAAYGAGAVSGSTTNKTYNQQSSVNLSGNSFIIRDEIDIRSLAIEIAALTKRQQHGKGLRMA